ncbi:hypothetical protein PYW07_005562 [Mythimna separata]|uniref:Uncharacterized protein n=1 Tax=Mythimna separata TaxID=271217 RepID=A0AAD8DS13_MYTSE|nr:hypothetical protein PYW07_005562 [Mythimna separata]
MKWFLISLALGLAASDKLDRTYLPPPGAQFSGGILGHHDAPLKPPHHTNSGQGPVVGGHDGTQPGFGINGEPVNFGDKIPKVPVTTTSYAFSQTTTFPSGEGFKTDILPINPVTGLPINPVTGLPIQLGQENIPNGPIQGQAPSFGTNIQPGFGLDGQTSAPINNGSPGFHQFANQPLNQYQGQNVLSPGGSAQIPGVVLPGQNQGQLQFSEGQGGLNQQRPLPTNFLDNQRIDQYPGQNAVNPGGVIQIPGVNQGLAQYPGGQTVTGQQAFGPSTGSPTSTQPSGNQYGLNYDGSQGPIPQGTFNGQPINVPNLAGTQPTQTSYQNQQPINGERNPSQYPSENLNYGPSVPNGSGNIYQPGSSPSTIPASYNNGISGTTPVPSVPSSTSSYYSTVGPVYRPERPQAAADRNAVILNYENVRTPNGYSYSFDTSNGIHADESGIVDNGTKAQGSYSYIGDDGKVYSVIYTADENGFRPRGDHLPTPPPIPEAIQRVIDQVAREKAAGIVHDGSYDEAKYGDKLYQETEKHRRPQNQFGNDQLNGRKGDLKPIVGIKDVENNEDTQDQFSNDFPVTVIGTRKDTNGKLPGRRPSNQINGNNDKDSSDGTRKGFGDFDSPKGTFDGNSMPIAEVENNQQTIYGTMKQGSSGRPASKGNNLPVNEANDSNQNNLSGSKNRGSSSRRPMSGGVKDATEKYPGSNVNVGATDYPGNYGDGFDSNKGQSVTKDGSGSPSTIFDGSGENINTNFDNVTGTPIVGNKKQILGQRVKGSRRPGSTGNRHNQNKNGRPHGETSLPSFGDKNTIENKQGTQHDDTGYHYQQPNNRFEQNTFPTRFNTQEVTSTRKPDQRRTEYGEDTTLRPFMTPNVYNKNDRNSQTTPNGYNQNNRDSQSTTRRPFTTIGVTSPSDNSYTDYDNGDDYATDQDIGDEKINSNRYPTEKSRVTSRPYQSTQTTSRPQNVPGGQRTRVSQKGTVTPGQRTETTGTGSPEFTYGSTTQMPTHNSRFGNTESPRLKPQQYRPSIFVPDSTTAVGSPITRPPSGTRPTDNKYQTTGPNSKYSGTNVGSGYPTTGSFTFPGSGSNLTTPGVSTPQDYYTTTYGPTQGYPSTTAIPPTYGYIQGSGSQVPSGTPGLFQPSQDQSFQTGYHYGPPKSGSVNLDGPGFFTPTGNTGVFPTSPTGTYQTNYQPNNGGFPSTTLGPVTSGQGTYNPFQPGTVAPETSPFGTYQENYQNGPSTPDYGNTIVSTTPGGKPVFKYPGSPGGQGTTGFEYGPSQPTYSTTDTPSTLGTTPGSFIPSGTTDPSQGYSTTYRPRYKTTKDKFEGGPVDGFGRPITPEQGGYHTGFGNPAHGTTGPNFGVTDQPNKYPGSYDQIRVIGEDFSGPKQPQRFDPKTGYHYK